VPLGAPLFVFLISLLSSLTVSAQSGFPSPSKDFDQYTSDVYTHIKSLSLPRTDKEIRLNLPFQLNANKAVPYRGRFLLFHGLNDSAYIWQDVAKEMAAKGFDVRAILFEGHGSSPTEQLNVSYKRWLTTARQHRDHWTQDGSKIHIGGFSMGGVIATILALEQPQSVAGLFLVSPAFHSKMDGYLRWSALYSKFKPWVFGGMIMEDNPIKYNSIPINSVAQYYKTTRVLKRKWRDRTLDMPVLVVATANDSVIDVDYTQRLFIRRFTHPSRKMVLYYNPSEREDIHSDDTIEARNARYPALQIINQSHLSLINRPENNLFGEAGRILVCNGNEYPIFMRCMRAKNHWYGAQHTPLPSEADAKSAMARTTYNPDFTVLLERFDEVFATQ
jgi:esterase/lipase